MDTTNLSADYLVIGGGAMGMAFSDVLIAETDATVIMVDKHHQPGGHWNDAYPYRLEDDIKPTMFRCATVTRLELEQLRRIENIVRLGRVQRIDSDTIILDGGTIPTDSSTLHVDCSADGLERRPAVPVFDGETITLQSLRTCQQVFSAAFIGHVEATYDESTRNQLCTPIPHPNSDVDWLKTTLANYLNQARWSQDEGLQKWLLASRLDGFRGLLASLTSSDPGKQAAVQSMTENMLTAIAKLKAFLAEVEN